MPRALVLSVPAHTTVAAGPREAHFVEADVFLQAGVPRDLVCFLAIFVLTGVLASRRTRVEAIPMLIVPVIMTVLGYLLFRRLLFDLVDEVWDDGDALIVRKAGVEERVPLKNIINIGYSLLTNPERVTLTLRNPGPLGKEITFMPVRRPFFRFQWLSRNPIIDELIERADQARRRADI